MQLARRQGSLRRTAIAGLTLAAASLAAVNAQPGGPCLVAAAVEPADSLKYSPRVDRCEGVLPRYVGYGDSIELVGYEAGSRGIRGATADFHVPGAATRPDSLTVRALSLTSRKRYQMDRILANDGRYRWSLDLVQQAQKSADVLLEPATLGIVACTNRCANRPDTVYFPVIIESPAGAPLPTLNLKLRADVIATNVRASLRPYAGGAVIEPSIGRLELYPDELAGLSLPSGLPSGEYRLEVRATNSQTRQQMSSLLARIVVP